MADCNTSISVQMKRRLVMELVTVENVSSIDIHRGMNVVYGQEFVECSNRSSVMKQLLLQNDRARSDKSARRNREIRRLSFTISDNPQHSPD